MNSTESECGLRLFARRQHGVVALGQLLNAGATRGVIRGLRDRGVSAPNEVTGPVNRTPRPGIVHRRRVLAGTELSSVDNIPVVSVARALLDLCESEDSPVCKTALDAALREGLIDLDDLRALLDVATKRRLARWSEGCGIRIGVQQPIVILRLVGDEPNAGNTSPL